jgi:hypothetical protein
LQAAPSRPFGRLQRGRSDALDPQNVGLAISAGQRTYALINEVGRRAVGAVSLVACGPRVVPKRGAIGWVATGLFRTALLLSTLLSLIILVRSCYSASRHAGFALPGGLRLVQVERPAGRMTRTRRAWSGRLRCAAGRRGLDAGIPERPNPGRAAPAAGGRLPVVGPGALPAGGRTVCHGHATEPRAKNRGSRSRSPPRTAKTAS